MWEGSPECKTLCYHECHGDLKAEKVGNNPDAQVSKSMATSGWCSLSIGMTVPSLGTLTRDTNTQGAQEIHSGRGSSGSSSQYLGLEISMLGQTCNVRGEQPVAHSPESPEVCCDSSSGLSSLPKQRLFLA